MKPDKKPFFEDGLPCSIDAEKAILGSILLSNEVYGEAAQAISPDDFHFDSHRKIYARMVELQERGQAIDYVTLGEALGKKKEVEAIGGISYLASLTDGLPLRPSIEQYVRIVKDKSKLRRLIGIFESLISKVALGESAEVILEELESSCYTIASNQESVSEQGIEESTKQVFQGIISERDGRQKASDLRYGIEALDEATGGIHEDELITIAARTSHGKTFFAMQIAANNASQGHAVDIYELEMRKEKLIRRLLGDMTGISSYKLRKAKSLSNDDLEKIACALEEIGKWPMRIYDRRDLGRSVTVQQLAWRIKRNIALHKTELSIVDYLQLLHASEEGKLVTDNYRRVSLISETFAALKTQTGVPIIQVSQLSRPKDEKEREGPPNLYSLKQSGEIENDTDTAILLWMERKKRVWTGRDLIILAKQREGPVDDILAHFDKERLKWKERAPDPEPVKKPTKDAKAEAAQMDF